MTRPPNQATRSPATTYSAASFQPRILTRITAATSLIIGEAIRKEKVTPTGIPASTKPMNSGTEEQEQNGVIAPRVTAMPRACQSGRLRTYSRTRSGDRKARSSPIA
jgi:hypothetical protein